MQKWLRYAGRKSTCACQSQPSAIIALINGKWQLTASLEVLALLASVLALDFLNWWGLTLCFIGKHWSWGMIQWQGLWLNFYWCFVFFFLWGYSIGKWWKCSGEAVLVQAFSSMVLRWWFSLRQYVLVLGMVGSFQLGYSLLTASSKHSRHLQRL